MENIGNLDADIGFYLFNIAGMGSLYIILESYLDY